MDLIRKINRNTLIILFPLAMASAFIEWKKLPFSILISGMLGLFNIRALAWGVQGLLGPHKSTAKTIFFSQFRLVMLFLILTTLILLRLVSILGVLAGFTVVFVMVIIEGLKHSRGSKIKEEA
jgi:hypothetical protein